MDTFFDLIDKINFENINKILLLMIRIKYINYIIILKNQAT